MNNKCYDCLTNYIIQDGLCQDCLNNLNILLDKIDLYIMDNLTD